MRLKPLFAAAVATGLLFVAPGTHAQSGAAPLDPIQALQAKLQSGAAKLDHRGGAAGYLPSVLEALDIPVDSQLLVFSKTSLQSLHIGPKAPRALYFNDDTTVGVVQGGDLIEITTVGADGALAFYILDAAPKAQPAFEKEGANCLACHGTVNRFAPGLIVANVIPQDDGSPLLLSVEKLFDMTDATTPFEQRWGGWYVTGQSGKMRHMGNVLATFDNPAELDPTAGLNVTDLSSRVDVKPYLAPTSDIVALMTFEHQVGAMNRIWKLRVQAGSGTGGVPPEEVDKAIDDLVAYLVGVDETPLPDKVQGASSFSRTFVARGPRDAKGRSLRDFDLQTRLFRYPLSYTIYGQAFGRLEPALRERIYRRLFEVLSGADGSARYANLPAAGKRAALEILRDTKPDLPAYWRAV